MADADISSHLANNIDVEQARRGDATKSGDGSEVKDTDLIEVEGLDDEAAIPKGTIDPVYEAKARVLNHAVSLSTMRYDLLLKGLYQIQEIGMGWYQWQLFIVVGFGWANDNLWPIVTSLICKSVP